MDVGPLLSYVLILYTVRTAIEIKIGNINKSHLPTFVTSYIINGKSENLSCPHKLKMVIKMNFIHPI